METLEDIKNAIEGLGLYAFLEIGESINYLGVCVDVDCSADLYIYENGEISYINNLGESNIAKVYGYEKLGIVFAFANSFKLIK